MAASIRALQSTLLAVLASIFLIACAGRLVPSGDPTASSPSVSGTAHTSPTPRLTDSYAPPPSAAPTVTPAQASPPVWSTPPPDEPGEWRVIQEAPVPARWSHTAVWTGTEMLVWGGWALTDPRHFNDGAAYDPCADAWRALPDAPIDGRKGQVAVWTGAEMIVWGGSVGVTTYADGAAYDPVTDNWRVISESPLDSRTGHVAAWTGSEVIIWGGNRIRDGWPQVEGAAYDPATDLWRELPPSPLPPPAGVTLWTGTEVIAFAYPDSGVAVAAAYDPASDRWRELAPSLLNALWAGPAAWSGSEVLFLSHEQWSGRGPAPNAAYDPSTDTWRPLSSGPRGGYGVFDPVWSGSEVLIYGYQPVAYHPASDSWRRLTLVHGPPGREGHSVVWSGDEMLVWGGTGGGIASDFTRADGLAFRPYSDGGSPCD